ncbi:hypothetical protein L0156_06435 [bacterium]|nr:hypothetical protein [bacterium]
MKNRISLILGWMVIALFIFGIIYLMMLRFSSGDVYPHYSSLRTDPTGTKAFYESLEICCDFHTERNHEPFSRMKNRFDSTFLVLGMEPSALANVPKSIAEEVNYFISNGGRMVISLYKPPKERGVVSSITEELSRFVDLGDLWGVRIFSEKKVTGGAFLEQDFRDSGLPRNISAHTPLYFQTVHADWKTIYQRAQHPFIIERKFGRGSIVLSAESYFLSNEAMAKEPQPDLLVWLVGNKKSVIFDEYHHGIASDSGVMYLARKYDLEWFLSAFVLLALLFIWKSAAPLVAPEQESVMTPQSGKESIAGLTNLLRRNVPVQQLLSVSFSEWQKSAKNITEAKQKEMESIVVGEKAKPARQRNLPAAYNALGRALKQRR